MSVMKAKVPAVIATGIICLLVGGGVGAAIMGYAASSKKEENAQVSPGGDENAKGAARHARRQGAGREEGRRRQERAGRGGREKVRTHRGNWVS